MPVARPRGLQLSCFFLPRLIVDRYVGPRRAIVADCLEWQVRVSGFRQRHRFAAAEFRPGESSVDAAAGIEVQDARRAIDFRHRAVTRGKQRRDEMIGVVAHCMQPAKAPFLRPVFPVYARQVSDPALGRDDPRGIREADAVQVRVGAAVHRVDRRRGIHGQIARVMELEL